MLKTEESRIAITVIATFALLLVTGIYPRYVVYATLVLAALVMVLVAYSMRKGSAGDKPDERTAKCSLAASRNGFIVAIVLMTLLGAAVSIGAPISVIAVTQIVWGLSMAAYFLSYLYYKRAT